MVLIVEDEAVSRRALQHLLQLHGYEACAAGSAEEAIDEVIAVGCQPEMALVDINLPGMTGVELVRRLHRLFPATRCVFMTSSEQAREERLGSACPEPTLLKPFDVPALLHLIAADGGDAISGWAVAASAAAARGSHWPRHHHYDRHDRSSRH